MCPTNCGYACDGGTRFTFVEPCPSVTIAKQSESVYWIRAGVVWCAYGHEGH